MKIQLRILVLSLLIFWIACVISGAFIHGPMSGPMVTVSVILFYFIAGYISAKLSAPGSEFINMICAALVLYLILFGSSLTKSWIAPPITPLIMMLSAAII